MEKAVDRVQSLCDAAKTIIVVSHSSALISEMATEAIGHKGKVRLQGDVVSITKEYQKFQSEVSEKAQLLS